MSSSPAPAPAPAAAPAAAPAPAPAAAAPAPAPAPAAPAPAGSFLSTPAPAAPGSPPAPAGPRHVFSDAVQKDGAFQEGWTQQLRDAGFERLATKAALAKDEPTLLRSLDEALGLIGRKADAAAYPGPDATPDQISAFRAAAGVPTEPAAYDLKPAELPPGVEWDDAAAESIGKILHQHHIPKGAAQAIVQTHLAQVAATAQAAAQQRATEMTAALQTAEATFAREWGDQHEARREANITFVQSRLDAQALSDPAIQLALSHPAIVRIVDEARRALREAPLPGVGHEAGGGTLSPRQQAYEIMKANPNWNKDADTQKRVQALYALDAAQAKRARK